MAKNASTAVLEKVVSTTSVITDPTEPVLQLALNYLERIPLDNAERILDIGCRDGRITAHLAESYPDMEIVAIEMDDDLAEAASRRLAPYGERVRVVSAEAGNVMITRPFDAVLSFSTLHWIDDKSAAFASLPKALQGGGGHAYLQFFANHGRKRFDDCIFETVSHPDWAPHFENSTRSDLHFFESDPQDIELLVEKNGLETVSAEFVRYNLTFADRNVFATWLGTWVQTLHLLPKALHPAFLECVVDQYCETSPPNADGQIVFRDYLLELELARHEEED